MGLTSSLLAAGWFDTLSVGEKIYFLIAVIASGLLVIQIVLMLFSLGGAGDMDFDGGFDGDFDLDGDAGSDGGLSFFTIKGMTAFFALGGWCGYAAQVGFPDNIWAPILIAVGTGTAALLGVGFAMRGLSKMQNSGNLVKHALVGKTATVYVSIPSARSGRGKIVLTAQDSYMELDAMTDDGERLPVDTKVEIVEYSADFALVARAVDVRERKETEQEE